MRSPTVPRAVRISTGGVVDGATADEGKALGVDLHEALRLHDTSPALWRLRSGVLMSHGRQPAGILRVALVLR